MDREKRRAAWRRWYQLKGKEQNRERVGRWREQNRERWNAIACKAMRKTIVNRRMARGYEQLLESQNGCCAICETPFTETPRLDHDHVSGEMRGLLCNHCNLGIGLLNDDSELVRKALLYLEKYTPRKSSLDVTFVSPTPDSCLSPARKDMYRRG
jgi:Recombination endonuclease VII